MLQGIKGVIQGGIGVKQGWYKGVIGVLQEFYRCITGCYRGVSGAL